jgi:pseudouridine-5'-phosphate glycosidase
VDPRATLERLEELGVGVIGYRCTELPFFLSRDSGLPLEHHAESPPAVAKVVTARRALAVESALLVCNPIEERHALPAAQIVGQVDECQHRAERQGVAGKDLTPFLLRCLSEATGGASLRANMALLEANAGLAARIATALAAAPRA